VWNSTSAKQTRWTFFKQMSVTRSKQAQICNQAVTYSQNAVALATSTIELQVIQSQVFKLFNCPV
jgi:hypothetical protein